MQTYIHQAETRHHLAVLPFRRAPAGRERARRRAGVHKELVHILEALEAVRAAPAQHVDVQLVRLGQQQVGLVGDQREAFQEADPEAPVRDDLGEREGRGLDVEAALDDLEVRRDGAEVLVGGLVGQVSEAERLGDLSWGEQFFELWIGIVVISWCLSTLGRRVGESRTLGGMSRARSGMWRSPITRMRKAMLASYGKRERGGTPMGRQFANAAQGRALLGEGCRCADAPQVGESSVRVSFSFVSALHAMSVTLQVSK